MGCQAGVCGVSCSPITTAPGTDTGAASLRRSVARALARGASDSWFLPQYTRPGPKPQKLPRQGPIQRLPLRASGHGMVSEAMVERISEELNHRQGRTLARIAADLGVGPAAVRVISRRLAAERKA